MTKALPLSSGTTGARNRSQFLSPQSGMCSFCTEDCPGTCEIALAAVLGQQTVYPTTTGSNQVAGEKDYGFDWSDFNINGRVFGAVGCEPTYEEAEIYNVKLEREYGVYNRVKMAMPFMLPAIIKLNWKDYFGGAAMAGVSCTIGEGCRDKDPDLEVRNGKIVSFPWIKGVIDSFDRYYRGYGQIFLQINPEDDMLGVAEVALEKYGCEAVEIKFGQSAKGTQPVVRCKDLAAAKKAAASGLIVKPDPNDPAVEKAYAEGVCGNFYQYARLPQWTEEYLVKRVRELRQMGAKNIGFKMTGYDKADIEKVLRIAAAAEVDNITFDGAGGGSGYSPCHMMNEFGLTPIMLESAVVSLAKKLKAEGLKLPAITVAGGYSNEGQAFKALAYGEGEVMAVGFTRAAMAAAMTGKSVGDAIKAGKVPPLYERFGSTVEDVFTDLADLRAIYGKEANGFSTGAIGVFSFLRKIGFGIQHFAALNRKFDIRYLDRTDLIPLNRDAAELLK